MLGKFPVRRRTGEAAKRRALLDLLRFTPVYSGLLRLGRDWSSRAVRTWMRQEMAEEQTGGGGDGEGEKGGSMAWITLDRLGTP